MLSVNCNPFKKACVKVFVLVEPMIFVHVGVPVLRICHSYSIVAVELFVCNAASVELVIGAFKVSPGQMVKVAVVVMLPEPETPSANLGT